MAMTTVDTHDQKACAQHDRLHFHVQIQRECDAEEIRIGEHFARQARPLFGDSAHLLSIVGGDLELDIAAKRETAQRPLDAHHRVAVGILDGECRTEYRPFLLHGTDRIARRCGHFHALQAARETATGAGQRSVQIDDGVPIRVHDFHVERPSRTATVARTAVVLLDGPVDLLTETVLDGVLVVCLEAGERLQQFDLLLDQQLVNSSKVLEPRGTVRQSLWNVHPSTCEKKTELIRT